MAQAPAAARGGAPPLSIAHVRQRAAWDCGLACAEMVLRAARAPPTAASFEALAAGLERDSVWTPDLLLRLARAGLRGVTLHTVCAGVDPSHADEAY
jgi:hypothetical protein